MAYEIKGNEAIYTVLLNGQNEVLTFRKLKVREQAYFINEILETDKSGGFKPNFGNLILSLPKFYVKEKSTIKFESNTEFHESELFDTATLMDMATAILALHGFINPDKKKLDG